MAKIIHASQMLETPQVNILNDNVIDSVNYSYNATTTPYKETGEFSFTGYIKVGEPNIYNDNVKEVVREVAYNPDIYDIETSSIKTTIIMPNTKLETTQYNYYTTFKYKLNIAGKLIKPETLSASNARLSYLKYFDHDGISQEREDVDFSTPYSAYANLTIVSYTKDEIICEIKVLTYTTADVYDNSQISSFYRLARYCDTFTFDFVAETISTETIQIDNNSKVTLESNELITQDTKIAGIQISEYISNNIKNYYENGKATISMQVIDDGTEYDVGDIIQPMKSETQEFYHTITDINKITNNDTEIILENLVFFDNQFYGFGSTGMFTDSKFGSKDGLNYSLIISDLDINASSKVLDGNLVTMHDYGQYFTITDINYQQKLLCNVNTTGLGSYIDILYYDNYYYIMFAYGLAYININDIGGYATISKTNFDIPVTSCGISGQHIFATVEGNHAMFYWWIGDKKFDTVSPSIPNNEKLISCVQSDSVAFFVSDSNRIIKGPSGTNTSVWKEVFNLGNKYLHFLTYNPYIKKLFMMLNDGLYISSDYGNTWTHEEDLLAYNVSTFTSFPDGLAIESYEMPSSIGGKSTYNSNIIKYYEKVIGSYFKDIESPLILNQDGTPKTFEITSSELVFDGRSYYNIDAVEFIDKQDIICQIVFNEDKVVATHLTITDTNGKTYNSGEFIAKDTVVTIAVDNLGSFTLNWIKVNEEYISNGSQYTVSSNVHITYQYSGTFNFERFVYVIGSTGTEIYEYNPKADQLTDTLVVTLVHYDEEAGTESEERVFAVDATTLTTEFVDFITNTSLSGYVTGRINNSTLQINRNDSISLDNDKYFRLDYVLSTRTI